MKALAKGFASIVMLMALAPGCSSSPAKGVDAAGTKDVGQTSDVGQARDVPPEVPANATLDPPTDVSFPEAPEIACSGDAAECPFPPSACGDPSCDGGACPYWAWVVYYDSPTCVNGRCAYVKKYFRCDSSSICAAGGCRFNGTA